MEINLAFPEPDGLQISVMNNLGQMLGEFMPDWAVKYMRVDQPFELREFFTDGKMFNRATYQMYRYEHEFFIHIDFKEKVEIYVVQKRHTEILRRKLYIVDRPDSLKLFRIITDELENAAYGYKESKIG